jgi:hypothetical protein
MDIELPDISNFRDVSDLYYIFFGILTVDVVVLFLTRYYKVGGKYLNEWYDQYGFLAVLADVLIIFIGFLIARYIYTAYFYERFQWNPVYFIILLCVVQLIHDILFYVGVIKPLPTGHNEMIDTFKRYADDLGVKVLGADAMLMIGSAIVAMLFKYVPLHVFVSISSLVSYLLPYILYTRNPYIAEEKERAVALSKEKKQTEINKIDAYGRLV